MTDPRFLRGPARRAAAALLVALLAWLTPSRALAITPGLADSIARLIPDGAVTVDILTPQYSPRMQEIARRLDDARQANPHFFQAWVASHPGGPPPWNPAFNVTRAEYDDYLREGRAAPFVTRTHARLAFQRAGRARRWTLHGWGLLGPLDKLVLDVDGGKVVSPGAGVLPLFGVASPNEPGVQLKWRWYAVWKAQHAIGDPAHGGQAMQASLHVGPLDDGHTTGMYWVLRRFNKGQRLEDEFLLLRFRPGP